MIVQLLQARAAEKPDHPLVVTEQGSWSYAQILDLSQRFATRLSQAGVGPGQHVALLAGNSAAYLVAWFGINALGAVAVALNNQLMGQNIDYLVDQSDSILIVADTEWLASRAPDLEGARAALPRIEVGPDEQFFADLQRYAPAPVVAVRPHDICTILYTSGTTGRPKGVMCSHASYAATGRHSARILELSRADRTMVCLPLFHTNPQTYAVMSALTVGCTLIVRPRFSASTFFEDAKRFGATGCSFVGTVLAILASRYPAPERDHALRFAIGGGTNVELATTILERFGFFVHELYGMTEVGGWASGSPRAEHRLGANGKVRDDMLLQIVDEEDRPVPAGQRGEIVIRPQAPHVILMGYYNKPEEYAKATRNLWFHTGDVGSLDADGFVHFHGRSKEVIRRGGEMISPDEIELHLRQMPGVADCAIVAVADAIMGDEIKAIVVWEGPRPEPQAVHGFLCGRVPPFMRPRYVEFVEQIPRTQTEKILRRQLQYLDERVTDLAPTRT